MKIDLSTLKIGDQVKFRNGNIDTVLGIKCNESELYSYILFLNNHEHITTYCKNGRYIIDRKDSTDIVEIIPQKNIEKEKEKASIYNPATAKTDTGKDRLDLLPYAGLASAAKAFEYGLNEYGHNNYQNAKSFRPFLAAAIRHIMKKLDGEDLDKDSGLDHICHSLACLLMAEQIKSQGKPINDPDTMKPYGIRNKPKE